MIKTKPYTLESEYRGSTLIISFLHNSYGIGSIILPQEDVDLFPFIVSMINGFNLKYTEEAPKAKTG